MSLGGKKQNKTKQNKSKLDRFLSTFIKRHLTVNVYWDQRELNFCPYAPPQSQSCLMVILEPPFRIPLNIPLSPVYEKIPHSSVQRCERNLFFKRKQ